MNKDMTLKEGIELFNKRNMKYFDERPQSQKGSEFLRCHVSSDGFTVTSGEAIYISHHFIAPVGAYKVVA